MTAEDTIVQELLQGPKPISVEISTIDIQLLYAAHTNPDAFMQLILAKLKDAGAPVEGILRLRLAHGRVCKIKDSIFEEQKAFTYIWLPENYVEAIANAKVGQA